MTNRLAKENSIYLLQHSENPVDWYPWGVEAINRAMVDDKPIFLSVGYAACHWCHVMEMESFQDEEIAKIMNQYFINIKVDREERPDIDNIYMQAVVALTGRGGWPMSVFLTPDGKPFYGGTYFPPKRRFNMPSFKELLMIIAQLWGENRQQLLTSSQNIYHYLEEHTNKNLSQRKLDPVMMDQAVKTLLIEYDWNNGGWGSAPKFPQPMVLEYLLRRGSRSDNTSVEMAVHTLHAMALGGMYDLLGGGFSRYSVDEKWHLPHFEKMLCDNAQLALVYLHAFLLTGVTEFRKICEQTLDFIAREMTHPFGGFFSSIDADLEGEEGKYYLWTKKEILEILDNQNDTDLFLAAFDVGDFDQYQGKIVLRRSSNYAELGKKFSMTVEDVSDKIASFAELLYKARNQRVRPKIDNKVLVFWNSLALSAFAEAGRYLKRDDYVEIAIKNANFLLKELLTDGRLCRSWRDGQTKYDAYLEDYAGLILGLIALYQADYNPRWYQFAVSISDELVGSFLDPAGGFFDTRLDKSDLILRSKVLQDYSTPSGNALAALALLNLSSYGDRPQYRDNAEAMIGLVIDNMVEFPTAFGQWLCVADFILGPTYEVALLGKDISRECELVLDEFQTKYRPRVVIAFSTYPPPSDVPMILKNKKLLNDKTTIYVCEGNICNKTISCNDDVNVL